MILRHGNKVATVLRKNTGYSDGDYGLPAGKVEWHEPYKLAAIREAKEEVGVDVNINDLRFVHVAHRHGEKGEVFMDWVDIYFEADKWQGEPHNAEPEKAEKLEWLDITNLPKNVVPPQQTALLAIAKGETYSEYGWDDSAK